MIAVERAADLLLQLKKGVDPILVEDILRQLLQNAAPLLVAKGDGEACTNKGAEGPLPLGLQDLLNLVRRIGTGSFLTPAGKYFIGVMMVMVMTAAGAALFMFVMMKKLEDATK